MKPRLALRSLNDIRRANPLAYLSLRYTLSASAAQKDRWATEIATQLIFKREADTFLTSYQFKELIKRTKEFRTIHLPGGSEILAESALLAICADIGEPFQPSKQVYSYRFPSKNATKGSYEPYFELYCERQEDVAKMCRKHPDHIVLYADIKQFYPSITPKRAKRIWKKACADSGIPDFWMKIGDRLLVNQAKVGVGTCVGPRFSHLIANLILRDLDKELEQLYPKKFFRYVDDIILVIPKNKKRIALASIRKPLKKLRLKLNPKKIHSSPAAEWLSHAPIISQDYDENPHTRDAGWMKLIDHLKCYLMANPRDVSMVQSLFKTCEFRIPLPRYQAAIEETDYTSRYAKRTKLKKFIDSVRKISPASLLSEALSLREHYITEFFQAWDKYCTVDDRFRKWHLSRLRYLSGRLLLVASESEIVSIQKVLETSAETREYAVMFRAIAHRDVTDLVTYGSKICASVGQSLAATEDPLKCFPAIWRREVIDGYVSLLLVGCRIDASPSLTAKKSPSIKFANDLRSQWEWKLMPDGFFRELFALSDGRSLSDHQNILRQPFDPDEDWAIFADDLVHGWES